MNDNAVFKDAEGASWLINITYGDILRVKQHVIGADNKPLDLCYIAETGDFKQVIDHIEILVQSVFWLLSKDIEEYTGKNTKDAMEWFYNRIDSETLDAMTKAWYEGIINFTPSQAIKTTMKMAWDIMTQEEIIEAMTILAGRLGESMNMQESLELTPEDLALANSARWLKPV